ncbi:MAG TPA: peptidylprolyl isomerase [Thermoanaerobaculia bacterium]|nr:peptidylprolyl isomerase [Thermoanaerobaculia bacterium]
MPPDVIAQVGERTVTLEDYKKYLQRNAGVEMAQVAPAASSALLDQFLEEILLAEFAAASGVDAGADKIAAAVRKDPGSTVIEKRDEMRRTDLLRDVRGRITPPQPADVRAYYDQHLEEFRLPERVHARQILLHDERRAREVIDQLKKGARFEDVAQEYSDAPNARNGGDIGYVGRGQLPPIFENELFGLDPGSHSRIIRTDDTFHIFRVENRAPAGPLPFEEASATIRTKLIETAVDSELMKLIARARKQIPTRVLAKRLPFDYSGSLPTSPNE